MDETMIESVTKASMSAAEAALGIAHTIEGEQSLDADEISSIVKTIRNLAGCIDSLAAIIESRK
jgi:hypothetical protein